MHFSKMKFFSATIFPILILVASFQLFESTATKCPYGRPNAHYKNEVYAFLLKSDMSLWEKLPMNIITTIALFMPADPDLVCLAHKNNVRIVGATSFPKANLTNAAYRKQWVLKQLAYAQKNNLDGINIDFEDPIDKTDDAVRNGLTSLIRETASTFHAKINGSQVTYDVAWSPAGIDDRFYDYKGIADAADFVFVMSYDEQSQGFSLPCTAKANSDNRNTLKGLQKYRNLGIPYNKMVLGLPWYGYRYKCVKLYKNNTCIIKKASFRGSICSDAVGSEVGYNNIKEIFEKYSTSPLFMDIQSKSVYFNFKENGVVSQMWFDNTKTLKWKYQMALDNGLLGVGMWSANFLDYSNTSEGAAQRRSMWDSIPYRH